MNPTLGRHGLVLKTVDAAIALAMSQGHLKRQMDFKGGPLIAGEDYFLGAYKTSPIPSASGSNLGSNVNVHAPRIGAGTPHWLHIPLLASTRTLDLLRSF